MDLYPLHSSQQPPHNITRQPQQASTTNDHPSPLALQPDDYRKIAEQVSQMLRQDLLDVLSPAMAARIAPLLHARQPDTGSPLASEVAHWKAETRKMDQIASEAMDKLQKKRLAKRALKAECETARRDVETWKGRYKDLASAQKQLLSSQSAGPSDAERAEIQEKLTLGGQAYRENKTLRLAMDQLKAAKTADEAAIAKLKAEVQQLKSLAPPSSAGQAPSFLPPSLAASCAIPPAAAMPAPASFSPASCAIPPAAAMPPPASSSKFRELELEVASGKEKVRAAVADASAKATKLMACTDMLARAEQVLRTCSQLHAAKVESAALSEALTETTENISQFLKGVSKPA